MGSALQLAATVALLMAGAGADCRGFPRSQPVRSRLRFTPFAGDTALRCHHGRTDGAGGRLMGSKLPGPAPYWCTTAARPLCMIRVVQEASSAADDGSVTQSFSIHTSQVGRVGSEC